MNRPTKQFRDDLTAAIRRAKHGAANAKRWHVREQNRGKLAALVWVYETLRGRT